MEPKTLEVLNAVLSNEHGFNSGGYERIAITSLVGFAYCEACVRGNKQEILAAEGTTDSEWLIADFISAADVGDSLTCDLCGKEMCPYESEEQGEKI